MNKERPDINETAKDEGLEAVRVRVENAQKFDASPETPSQEPEPPPHEECPDEEEESGDSTQAEILIGLASGIYLFHTSDGTSFADIDVNGHRETWPIRGKVFKQWLVKRFYDRRGRPPNNESLNQALGVIESRATFDGPCLPVSVRTATHAGNIYIDLADDLWRAVEIGPQGWRVVNNPPVRFRRPAGMLPMPMPVPGGSVSQLQPFLNMQSEDDFVLLIAWLLATLRGFGPYPVLDIAGEQGSAKSTFSAILRRLTDPNKVPLRPLPRDERDLAIAANNAFVLCFDNISGVPGWVSDFLCRLATGGGFATRSLYTDAEEVLFGFMRPVILNGIEDIVSRPDLVDRSIFLTLEPISDDKRRLESELWAAFDAEYPLILGALFSAISHGLQKLPTTKLARKPRMADFAIWITACEGGLEWQAGQFMKVYDKNIIDGVLMAMEASIVATAVEEFMSGKTEWEGTAKTLLQRLNDQDYTLKNDRYWPKAPNILSNKLRRVATALRKNGLEVTFGRGHSRTIVMRKAPLQDELELSDIGGP